MSQHALQEATEAIQNELLAFSYTMLKKGYDVEGIMEFLSVCDDEDIDFILEDADILTEEVVDEMSDEDVNYYGEQLEIIAESLARNLGAAALKRMPPSMLRRLAASNEKIAKLIRKLGLLDDGAKQTIKVKPPTRPSTIKPKPKTKPDSGSGSGTTKPTKPTSGSGTTKPTKPGLGQTLKNNKGKILTTTAIGAGLGAALFSDKVKDIVTGGNGSTSSDTASADTTTTTTTTDSTTKGDEDKKPPVVTKPKPDGKTPWWLGPGGDTTKLGRRPRYDVALQSYRNPSQPLRNGFEMVADYLISEGHADTVEEARYVINQMEVDDITEILNEVIQ